MSKKQYELTIEPITAIHIGTGDELTPLDYKVVKSNRGNMMYLKFSSEAILSRLIESNNRQALEHFEQASEQGNMKDLQDFFQSHCNDLSDLDYPCEITEEFNELYTRNRKKDPYDNAARVWQMYRPLGAKTPVIPGSSIKGAVRTAVLNNILYDFPDNEYNKLRDEYERCRYDREKERFESRLQKAMLNDYKDAKDDPFRCIEFLDCSFPVKNTQLVGVLKNIFAEQASGNLCSNSKMQIQAEVIKGSLMNTHATGRSFLRINTELQNTNNVSMILTLKDIIQSSNRFYLEQFENEYKKFYQECYDDECESIVELYKLLKQITLANENTFILRIGRWSQVEFVTFGTHFRNPKTREVKGVKLGYGGTRTIFNYNGQYLPMGWCKCTAVEI